MMTELSLVVSPTGCSNAYAQKLFFQPRQPHSLIMQGPLNTLMHTEPRNELENILLNRAASDQDRPMEPIVFPVDSKKHVGY